MKSESTILSIASQKCPHCHKGNLFLNPNPYNFKTVFEMPERCEKCGQIYNIEPGFWTGAMYVSYAIIVALTITNMVGFMIIFNWEVEYVMMLNIGIVLLLYPIILRYARTLYIYMFIKYSASAITDFNSKK